MSKLYSLRKNIIAYVKINKCNFNVMIIVVKSITNYEALGWENIFKLHVFKIMSICYEKEKIYKKMKYVFIESAQEDVQKCII